MKILSTSDMHGNLNGIEDYLNGIDIVCFAGDVAPLKGFSSYHVYDQKKWVERHLCELARKYPNIEFVFTPGNHDFFPIARQKFIRYTGELDWNIDWPCNMHMLIDSGLTIKGLKIFGTPYVPIISYKWAFESHSDELKQHFDKIPYDLDILITHAPPHISSFDTIDRSMQWGGNEAFGSSELTHAIMLKKPKYVFSGHIHTGGHECHMIDETKCYNVSRVDERYEIAFEPLILDIDVA